MNLKVKIALLIVVTLVIGIVLGALVNRALMQHRIRRTISRVNPGFLRAFYEEVLKPDAEQSQQLRAVIDEYIGRMSDVRESFLDDMQTIHETLWTQLDPLLTPEQKQRLRRRRTGPAGFPGRPDRFFDPGEWERRLAQDVEWLKEKLALTPEQVDRLREVLQKPPMPKPRQDAGTPKPFRDRSTMLGMRDAQMDQAIEEVLTPEQREIFRALVQEWRERIRDRFRGRRFPPPVPESDG